MSSKSSTTEGQTPAQPEGNFDAKGKFVRAKGVRYSPSTQALIARYNEIVDNLALFGDPAVAKHVLFAADISDKPSAIQHLAESLRVLLADVLKESQENSNEASQTALDALRTELTQEHNQRRTAANQEYVGALKDKDDQIGMRDRMDIYTQDVHDTVNAFVKLFGASLGIRLGINPLGTTAIRGSVLRKRFQISSFEFTLVTTRPGDDGNLRDTLTVAIAEDSDMPKLVSTQLELRSNPLAPGLSDQGRDTLDGVLRKLTANWFNETAPNLTDDELSRLFRDPRAARRYFTTKERKRPRTGVTTMASVLGLNLFDQHTGEEDCPACNALMDALLGEDGTGSGFDYVASGPLGMPGFSGLGSFGFRSGRGPRQNHTAEPQADPYHYDTVKPVDDPDYVQSDQTKE